MIYFNQIFILIFINAFRLTIRTLSKKKYDEENDQYLLKFYSHILDNLNRLISSIYYYLKIYDK